MRFTPSKVTLTNASNSRMRVTGETEVYCAALDGKVKRIRVIISPDLADRILLGWQAQIKLGLLHPNWPQVWDFGKCNQVNHHKVQREKDIPVDQLDLKLKEDAVPYMTGRVQKVNYHEMLGCMEALKADLNGGLLVEHDEAVHGPLNWLFYG